MSEAHNIPRRVLLKLSGEAFMDSSKFGIDTSAIKYLVKEIELALSLKVQLALTVGGGNILRGSAISGMMGVSRVTGDYMGMLATVINAMALQDALARSNIESRMQTALPMEQLAQPYIRDKANKYLEEGKVVIFAGGTGNPFFTTDTAASLRAIEIGAELLLKGTKVDGIYSDDPTKNKNAILYDHISFDDVISQKLRVMDATALTLCRDQNLPIMVFDIFKSGALKEILCGNGQGTLVSSASVSKTV